MQQKKHTFGLVISVASALVLAALAVEIGHRKTQRAMPTQVEMLSPTTTGSPPRSNRVSGASAAPLQKILASLKSAPDAKTARQELSEMRRAFAAMPTNAAAAAIRQILDSNVDAPTYLGFKVAADGSLATAPTLRTFLLDELAHVDVAAAAEYAKVVLASMDSADEWAVALRNLARGDTSLAGRTLLEQKMGDMLRYEAWQQNPSVGFLEAFDVPVYLGGTNLMPALTDLVRQQDNPAVAHAAFLALDRLVINDPATLLNALAADPALMQGREQTRANYFARADVSDAQQRQVLEGYLLNPQIGPAEMDSFAAVYPNANFMISPNLLTSAPTYDHTALTARDAESLRVVEDWLVDPRFAQLRPQLEKVEQRLAAFVWQAKER